MAEIVDLFNPKLTLRFLRIELMRLKDLQNLPEVLQMVRQTVAIDQDIVKKKNQFKLEKKWLEYIIHKPLEGGGGIRQTEGYYEELVMAVVSPKSRLRNIFWADTNLVVA
jgi:hypothetical protein